MKKLMVAFVVFGCALLLNAQNGYAHPKMTVCLDCHNFSGSGGMHTKTGHATCTSCHTTPGDATTTPSKCIVCHPAGNVGKCGLVSKHASGNCATCHTDCKNDCPAAAVLGDVDPRLAQIRTFRDKVLAKSAFGKRIINIYYNNADSINASLEKNPTLKAFSCKALQSFIPVLEIFM